MPPPTRIQVTVEGRRLALSNLDKIMYPAVGFTKAEVIDYYVRVASAMLPHVRGRGITMKRYPDGVSGDFFFEKRCPGHRPEWIGTTEGPGDRGGAIHYCCLDETAALAWSANMASLEIHAPMARGTDVDTPTMVVFDLDPGAPADITECCQVALEIRDVLEALGLDAWPKTSGNKGMQVYVPLNTPHTHEHASAFARAVGQLLARDAPKRITTTMKKSERTGKVFIDWSQNVHFKTTVAPYSLRANPSPTVSTPITWEEVVAGSGGAPLVFTAADVLERTEELGDLFAPTATLEQQLPSS